jgi:hypothetical protein
VGETGPPGPLAVGYRRMALSKALGRSNAPGGAWFLLGEPCGVCWGVTKSW